MKKITQITALTLSIAFSSVTNASLITDLFSKIERNEKVYEIESVRQHEAVLTIFRDIEFREGFVEIEYQEAPIGKNENIYAIRTTYLVEKEKLSKAKAIIKKLGLDIENLEDKDYELTLNYIYGHKAHFELKEHISEDIPS